MNRLRDSKAWSSGLGLDSYDVSLRPDNIDEDMCDSDIKEAVCACFKVEEDIVQNPKEKVSHEVVCWRRCGGICCKDLLVPCAPGDFMFVGQ